MKTARMQKGTMQNGTKALILIGLIVFIDQISKLWVKTHFSMGEEVNVIGNWFKIHFTENNGMAFGMEFGGDVGKVALSLFRIVAVTAIGWYIYKLVRAGEESLGVILGVSAIFAGALGNILDSLYYGVIFGESGWMQVAELFPKGGGYAAPLFGRVVDMLYFPVIEGIIPQWFPVWGGQEFLFFRPVFNIADSAITIGVTYMIIFQREFFRKL